MKVRTLTGRVAVAATAALGLVALGAPAALAGPGDVVVTDSVRWGNLNVTGYLTGLMRGIDPRTGMDGWRSGGWDLVGGFKIDTGTGWVVFSPEDPPTGDIYGDGLVYHDTFGATEVTLTLRAAGSYLQSTYTIAGDYVGAGIGADSAYDSATVWLGQTNGITGDIHEAWSVAYMDEQQGPPGGVLVHHVTTTGATDGSVYRDGLSDDADDMVIAEFEGASSVTLTTAYLDWSPCGFEEALDVAQELAPTLDETFGEAYPAFAGDCALQVEPQTFTTGVAVDGTELEYTLPAEVAGYWSGIPWLEGLEVVVEGLPDGVDHTVAWNEDGTPRIVLSGTPTKTGVFPVVLGIAGTYDGEGLWTGTTVSATADFTVVEPGGSGGGSGSSGSSGSGSGSAATLATTGSDGTPLALLAGVLLVAGALALTGRRLARR